MPEIDMNHRPARPTALVRRFLALPLLAVAGAAITCSVMWTPAATVLAAPEPAPIPKRWQLDVKTSPLRMAIVDTVGGAPRAYFYMTYMVTNNTASDVLFAPSFELATDEGDLLRSGRDVPFAVTAALLERLSNPMIEDQIGIVGNLLRGEENAKEGLVVWPIPTNHCNEVVVYAAGFSGETVTIEVPHPETGEPERKLLRKTLMLRYRVPGELEPAFGAALQPHETRWIMR
jgi:hypothetical protein